MYTDKVIVFGYLPTFEEYFNPSRHFLINSC